MTGISRKLSVTLILAALTLAAGATACGTEREVSQEPTSSPAASSSTGTPAMTPILGPPMTPVWLQGAPSATAPPGVAQDFGKGGPIAEPTPVSLREQRRRELREINFRLRSFGDIEDQIIDLDISQDGFGLQERVLWRGLHMPLIYNGSLGHEILNNRLWSFEEVAGRNGKITVALVHNQDYPEEAQTVLQYLRDSMPDLEDYLGPYTCEGLAAFVGRSSDRVPRGAADACSFIAAFDTAGYWTEIVHEVVHSYFGGGQPIWFREGGATFVSTVITGQTYDFSRLIVDTPADDITDHDQAVYNGHWILNAIAGIVGNEAMSAFFTDIAQNHGAMRHSSINSEGIREILAKHTPLDLWPQVSAYYDAKVLGR